MQASTRPRYFLNLFFALVLFSLASPALSADQPAQEKAVKGGLFYRIKGQSAPNAVLMGMWSFHLDGTGDIYGDGRNNEHNYLRGFQYAGVTAGWFVNSHDQPTVYAGLARKISQHDLSRKIRFDLGYKIGLLHGYGDELPNIGGVSVFFAPFGGLSYKKVGVDIGLIPLGVVTANFRYNI
jgi:hypothetical protein